MWWCHKADGDVGQKGEEVVSKKGSGGVKKSQPKLCGFVEYAGVEDFQFRRNLLNVLEFLKSPNASELVSGTRDRVNLHDKFRGAIEVSFPGTIHQLELKAEEKKKAQQKPTFWESVTDSKVGAFKFSF